MPAAPVASRTPAIGGMSGMIFGARGEMAEDTGKILCHGGTSPFQERRARLCPAIRVLRLPCSKDVDARDKPGHDQSKIGHFFAGAAGLRVEGSAAAAGG